jgi:4-amino-4-deoxy-L-arabinose transferase-like glycosyltransferase
MRGFPLILTGILLVAGLLRFWHIATRPGYDWDESVYSVIGANMANHDLLQAKTEAGFAAQPYLYHPPLYFMALGLWYRLVGTGIPEARVLAAIGSLVMLLLLGLWLRRLIGDKWALIATGVLAIDGWTVFTNRVGWFENLMMPIGIAGLWLYWKALKAPSLGRFIAAGGVLGFVVVFKHVGVYFLIAVLINWLIVRCDHKKHLALVSAVIATCAAYIGIMSVTYGTTYWDESTVQIQRILGMRESRGAVNSLSDLIDPLVDQYKIFVITLILLVVAGVMVLVRVVKMIRQRSVKTIGDNTILFSWAASSILCFGLMKLVLPHYLIMVIIPLFCYLASELSMREQTKEAKTLDGNEKRKPTRRPLILAGAALALIAIANVVAFQVRIADGDDNALKATAVWAHNNLPANAEIITEESVGAVISQPYCKIAHAGACHGATYIITYNSHTQQPPRNHTVNEMLATARKLKTFTGFKEDITILELAGPVK